MKATKPTVAMVRLVHEQPLKQYRAKQTLVAMPKCAECGRVFILANETDAAEWACGHDCQTHP